MTVRQRLGKIYRWGLHTFFYNDVWGNLFFPKGYSKSINNATIRVPFKYSWFYANIYEEDKTDFIKAHCKSGDTVIDIGAHMGIFSFFLAKQVGPTGKVYSFEPAPLTYSVLAQTIKYNKLEDIVHARQQAVSDGPGELSFYIYSNSTISNANSISAQNADAKAQKVTVTSISLDELYKKENIQNLSLLKIDAEGAELEILKGGKALITAFHPYITLEVHPKSFTDARKTMTELYQTIIGYGYKVYMNNKVLSLQDFCDHHTFFEVLLIPA